MNEKLSLIKSLEKIDSTFLDEYYERRKNRRKKRNITIKYGTVAASVVLLATLSICSVGLMNIPQNDVESHTGIDVSAGESTDSLQSTDSAVSVTDTISENKAPELSYEIAISNDYAIPTDAASMLEEADLVVEGVYDGTVSTYATKLGQIISVGKISNLKVVKGGVSENELEISFYGGSMSVYEYMTQISTERAENMGFDELSEEEAKTKYIGVPLDKYAANPNEETSYMFFLSYDEETGEYFVVCDAYGMKEVNENGEVWNIDSSEFEALYKDRP